MFKRLSGRLLRLLAFCLFIPVFCQAAVIGHVIGLKPGVTVLREGKITSLTMKDEIHLKDIVQNDATGKEQVIFTDDTTVTIGKNSRQVSIKRI